MSKQKRLREVVISVLKDHGSVDIEELHETVQSRMAKPLPLGSFKQRVQQYVGQGLIEIESRQAVKIVHYFTWTGKDEPDLI